MNKLLPVLALCAILSVGCSSFITPTSTLIPTVTPTSVSTSTITYNGDLSISMRREPVWGTNPAYMLKIDSDGSVTYDGFRFVAITGKRSAKITPEQVAELISAIRQSNVFALNDRYSAGADAPSITLSIMLNGQRKSIFHSGSLDCGKYDGDVPMALCDLEHKIDSITNVDQWVKKTP